MDVDHALSIARDLKFGPLPKPDDPTPSMDEAMKFEGSADQVILLDDCTGKNGTIQKTIRSAFFVAFQV